MKKSVSPRLPKKTKAGYRTEAFELLGVTEADMLSVPKIEPLLKQSGVLERVWNYLETSRDELARQLVAQKYKLLNASQRNSVPFEAFCVAAGLETGKVLGLIVSEVYQQNEQAALLMAASAQPDVVQATIDAAVQPAGTRERDMLHKHSGFVPVPKTSVTIVHGGKNVIGGGQQTNQTLAVLPPIEQEIRRVSDRFNERRLPAPNLDGYEGSGEVVDVEEDESDL